MIDLQTFTNKSSHCPAQELGVQDKKLMEHWKLEHVSKYRLNEKVKASIEIAQQFRLLSRFSVSKYSFLQLGDFGAISLVRDPCNDNFSRPNLCIDLYRDSHATPHPRSGSRNRLPCSVHCTCCHSFDNCQAPHLGHCRSSCHGLSDIASGRFAYICFEKMG